MNMMETIHADGFDWLFEDGRIMARRKPFSDLRQVVDWCDLKTADNLLWKGKEAVVELACFLPGGWKSTENSVAKEDVIHLYEKGLVSTTTMLAAFEIDLEEEISQMQIEAQQMNPTN